ncbi:hypothetical protein CD31_21755 [Lysinibacillus boronitolerans JCM 21713 = 10a = NBRC 103108]|uniref:Fibronectin type-III domain-containing protein n=1 Tax=Lysinibacillus boronitolerans JCM 21713 = 10a = NBRC 103108 TaxID=1294264 RepID=A0ABR4XUP4_9BACI|nr:hypothetical protein CD31_21755 [Lysinibacillus boronitolerans JCM 21713 = 10a = NBRC 103108]
MDVLPTFPGVGLKAFLTWNDSVSDNGTFTYAVKRNTVNDSTTATTIASDIASGIQTFTDNNVSSNTTYYYFIEVSDGVSSVISIGYELHTVYDI